MSRVDPNNVTVSSFGAQRFLVLPGKNTQCICVSLVYVHDCALVFGKSVSNTMNKKVGGVLHIQEHERLASNFCMQFDMVPELNVNAYGWVLYFSTRNADFGSKSKQGMSSHLICCAHTYLDLGSRVKSAVPAPSGYNLFSKYPGMAPKVQPPSPSKSTAVSATSPVKVSSSKPYKPFKPILDYHDTGTLQF
jgi:hypothetical protein